MGVRDLIEKKKLTTTPAVSAPSKPTSAVARLVEQKRVATPTSSPTPKPLKETPYSFGASDPLLGIKAETSDFKYKLAETQARSEEVAKAKDQLKVKRGVWGQYSHDVNEVMASANRGIGDTVNMFGKALTFLGKANEDAGLWKYYSKVGGHMTNAGSAMAEQLETKDSGAIQTILDNDPIAALGYKEFWLNKVPQTLVPSVALALPSMGVGGAFMGATPTLSRVLLATSAGSMVSRPVESASEAGDTYTAMIEKGSSEKEAMDAAQAVFADNMKLVGVDALQLALALTPFKTVLGKNPTFLSKLAYGTVATALGSGSEGTEEVYQLYVQKKAQDENFDIYGNESQQSFILGVIGGLAFQGVGFATSPKEKEEAEEDYLNKIIDKLPPNQQVEFNNAKTKEQKEEVLEGLAQTSKATVTEAVESVDKEYLSTLNNTKKAEQFEELKPSVVTAIQSGKSREEIALELTNQGFTIQESLDFADQMISVTPTVSQEFAEIDETLLEKTASQIKKETEAKASKETADTAEIKKAIADLQKRIQDPKNATQKETLRTELETKRNALQKAQNASQEDTVRTAQGLRALVEREVEALGVVENKAEVVERVITEISSGKGKATVRDIIKTVGGTTATPVVDVVDKKDTAETKVKKEPEKKTKLDDTKKDKKPAKNTEKDNAKEDTPEVDADTQAVADKDWEENYADKADELNKKSIDLAKKLKKAKKAEQPKLQKALDKVNKQAADLEAEFVDKYRVEKVFPEFEPAVMLDDEVIIVDVGDYVIDTSGKIKEIASPNREDTQGKVDKFNVGFVRSMVPGSGKDYIDYANQMRMATAEELTKAGLDASKARADEFFSTKELDTEQNTNYKVGDTVSIPVLNGRKNGKISSFSGNKENATVKVGNESYTIATKDFTEPEKAKATKKADSESEKTLKFETKEDIKAFTDFTDSRVDQFKRLLKWQNGNEDKAISFFTLILKTEKENFHEETETSGLTMEGAKAWADYQENKYGKEQAKAFLINTKLSIIKFLYGNKLISKKTAEYYEPNVEAELASAKRIEDIKKAKPDTEKELLKGWKAGAQNTIWTKANNSKENGYINIFALNDKGVQDGKFRITGNDVYVTETDGSTMKFDSLVEAMEYANENEAKIKNPKLDKETDTSNNKNNETSNNTGSDDNTGGTPEPLPNESKRPRAPKKTVDRPNGEDGNTDNGTDGINTGTRPSPTDGKLTPPTNAEIEAKVAELTEIAKEDGEVYLTIRAGEITDEVRDMVGQYTSGGVAKEGRGILDEYYTNQQIVSAIKGLLDFPARGLKVLEPSIGTGNFLYALPQVGSHNIDGYEINATTAGIAKIMHPDATIYNKSFETEFIDERGKKKEFVQRYDLVLGNPPYGEHRGEYLGLGEEPKLVKYEDYFVKRSLDVLKNGGTLAMVLPSSWLNRKGAMAGVQIEKAYRLPNGAFAGTDIGTDIVILRKADGETSIAGNAYFTENPQNILGTPGTRQGRFGEEAYVSGTLEDALASLDNVKNETEAIKILKELKMPVTEENVTEVAEVVDQAGKDAKAIVKAEKKTETKEQKQGKKTIETKVKKTSTVKGETRAINLVDMTPEMEALWRKTLPDGSTPLIGTEIAMNADVVNYMGGSWYLDFNYAQGDIYEKLSKLEADYRDKDIDEKRYNAQKAKLMEVLPTPETVADMKITPNMQFVKDFKMGVDANDNEITMATAFRAWLQKLPQGAFGTSNLWEIQAYVNNEQVRGNDQKYNERVRERRKRMADSLFSKYLNEGLEPDQKSLFENIYNQTFNFFHTPDYSQVPLFGQIYSNFEGRAFEPNRAQRKGIGRLMNTGVGILAHEVGFGKTISGVLTAYEAMERGWAKRPLIVVPNDNVASQWIDKTIMGLIPNAKVNFLGNLGANYKGDLSSLTIEEGSFTVVTYEGLKRLSFTDETYAEMAEKFSYVADELGKDKTKRDLEKEKADTAAKRGAMKKGTRADLTFEGLGFDHFTFDEAHNANHVVGKVKLKKGEASEFNRFGLMPSSLGIKTWLAAQYIQEKNNGRNVTLLSATPFTNHPLEYYSILSMVADSSLEKMGFRNVNEFFSAFMEASNEFEFKADGSYDKKTDIRSFKNYRQFRKLLDSFIDFEQDSPDILRPNRIQKSYEIPKNAVVREMEEKAQAIFTENEQESGKGAKILRAISELQLIAISPYLSQFSAYKPAYKEFIENSPKLDVVMQLIAQNKKDRPEAGQIIYSQKGVQVFPYLKDYLIKELGFKPEEVAVIVGGEGSVSPKKRLEIQKDFNAGKIKVLIGSDTITEGMNLQINTTDMHLLSLPWNFTALRQVIGRAWRQQNSWKNVRINQYFMQDSVDVFMSQKLDNKQRRYENAIKSNSNEVDVGDVSYNEFKFDLVKDPEARAKLELQSKKEDLNLAIQTEKSELAFATRRLEKVSELQAQVKSSQDGYDREINKPVAERNEYWVNRFGQEIVKYQSDVDEAIAFLKERGVSVESLLETKKAGEDKVLSLETELKNLETTFEERVKELRENAIVSIPYSREIATQFAKERAEENKTFYEKAAKPKAETVTVVKAPKPKAEVPTVLNPEPVVATPAKKTVVKKKATVRESKDKDMRVMKILSNPDLTIPEKVSEILDSKQEGKKFKDVGERVGGSKKERATVRTVLLNGDAGVIAEMIKTLGGDAVAETLNKADILEDAITPDYEADQKAKVPAMIADWKMRVLNNIAKTPVLMSKRGKYSNTNNVGADDMARLLTEYPTLLQNFVEELAGVTTPEQAEAFYDKYGSRFADFRTEVDKESRYQPLNHSGVVSIGVLGKTIEKIMREGRVFDRFPRDIAELKEILRKGAYLDKERLESDYSWDKAKPWVGLSYSGYTTYFENEADAKESVTKYREITQNRLESLEKRYNTGYDLYQKKKKPALEGVDLTHGNFEEIKVYDRKGIIPAKRITAETLTTELGFKSVQLGNYMDDATSKQHIEQAITAVEDMSNILGIDLPKVMNDKGLSIAFGARGGGRANAHYEPAKNIINLTKGRGDGSFGHELIHFFDWKFNNSRNYREKWSSKKTRYYTNYPIEKLTLELMQALTGQKIRKETTLEPQDDSYVLNQPENKYMKAYAQGVSFEDAVKMANESRWGAQEELQAVADVYRKPVTATVTVWNEKTEYYKESLKVGGGNTQSYWVLPHELLARAGQAYLEDKLAEKGIKNSYVTRPTVDIKHYPQGQERKIFNELFDKVFAVVAQQYPLAKEGFTARFKQKGGSQTMVAGSYALPFLRSVKQRLQIDFDVRFVDTILASDAAQKNKPPQEAWGAVIGNTVLLAKEITRWTAQHEVGHLIFNNLERLRAFKEQGITKQALVEAKIAQLRAKGISKIGTTPLVGRIDSKTILAVEEQIMLDFESYLENKYQPDAGIIKRFYLTLKRMVMSFARAFGAYPDLITDYYEMIDTGVAIDNTGASLETDGILDEYMRDRRYGTFDYAEAEALMGGARFKLREEGDKVLQKIEKEYNDTESLLTQKQEELEKVAVEMDEAIEKSGRLAQVVGETPKEVKDLKKNATRKPPVALTTSGLAKLDEYGFANKEEAEVQINEYVKNKTELLETRNQLAKIRRQIATLKRGSKMDKASLRDVERKLKLRKQFLEKKSYYVAMGQGQGRKEQMRIIRKRGEALNNLQDMIGLSDARAKSLIGELTKQKLHLMSEKQFDDFMISFVNRGTELANKLYEQQEVGAIIQEKRLNKVDNLRKAMKLPTITKMSAQQASLFAKALSEYEFGDTFLTTRQLETIHRTAWDGSLTEREMFGAVFAETGITEEDLKNVRVSGDLQKFKNWLVLSRSNPLFAWIIDKRFKAELETHANVVAFEEQLNPIVNKARASRTRPFLERFKQAIAPMDELVFGYIEAENKEEYRTTNEMTKEEVDLAVFLMTRLFLPAKDYMQTEYAMGTRENYITHIRRGLGETFINAISEGKSVPKAVREAVNEVFSSQKEDEIQFGILAGKTGDVVAFEKWFKFAMPRSGELVPTKNVAKASLAYARAYYKKRAVDSFVPEVMAVAKMQERIVGTTPKGLPKNPKVQEFINEMLNDAKGRKIQFITEQGSTTDNGLRFGVMFTAFKYLGFRPVLGLASFVGEFVATARATTMLEKWRGLSRTIQVSKAHNINQKYKYFTGRNPLVELFSPEHEITTRIKQAALVIYSLGSFFNTRFYLRAKMTEAEWKNELMNDERMVEITKEMSKWRKTPFYITSLAGGTAVGSVFSQFATWAIPIVTTTISDTQKTYENMQKDGFKRAMTSEEAISLGKTAAVMGTMFFIAMGIKAMSGDDDDERDIWFYLTREMNTLLGAFGVMFDLETRANPPLIRQLIDLMTLFKQVISQDAYKKDGIGYGIGDLKMWNTLEKVVLPSVVTDTMKLFSGEQVRENTKARLVGEAITTGNFDPKMIAETINPDDWNNINGERTPEKQIEYQEGRVHAITMEYNLRKKYPESKVADIILTVDNNDERVAKMLQYGQEVGEEKVYSEIKTIYRDKSLCGNDKENKVCPISDKLFKTYREAR